MRVSELIDRLTDMMHRTGNNEVSITACINGTRKTSSHISINVSGDGLIDLRCNIVNPPVYGLKFESGLVIPYPADMVKYPVGYYLVITSTGRILPFEEYGWGAVAHLKVVEM